MELGNRGTGVLRNYFSKWIFGQENPLIYLGTREPEISSRKSLVITFFASIGGEEADYRFFTKIQGE